MVCDMSAAGVPADKSTTADAFRLYEPLTLWYVFQEGPLFYADVACGLCFWPGEH